MRNAFFASTSTLNSNFSQLISAAVAERERHPSSKRIQAGATPAGSAIAQWDNSSPPGCYPGRCWCDSSLSSQFEVRDGKCEGRAKSPSVRTSPLAPRPSTEGRQIQAGCACLENRIGIAEVGALPTPSATFAVRVDGTSHPPLTKGTHAQVHHPQSKPVAPSPELQTKSKPPNPTGLRAEPVVPPHTGRSCKQNL